MKNTALIIMAALMLSFTACGYTMSRTGGAAGMSAGRYKVSVPLFVNDTYEPLVEKELTAALKDDIASDGRWLLTDSADADLSLTGKVLSFELTPLSYDEKERVQEYRVRIKTEVKLTDLKTGKVVWKDRAIETFSEYRVIRDVTKTKIGRGEAVKKASKDFADEVIIKAMESF